MLCAMTSTHSVALAAIAACLASATFVVQAQDAPEAVLTCIANGTKVGHTYIQHPDPAKLKEAVQIFDGQMSNTEYPEGTIIRAIPQEAMVKRSKAAFPNTNGWEYFALAVTQAGATVRERGDSASNRLGTCQSCHVKASTFDYVCRSGHDCPPVPLTEQQVTQLQAADPRCPK